MKIIVKKIELTQAIEKMNKIAKHKTLSLCDNILCVVDNNRITLSATNLEIQSDIEISGQINEPGQCLIPAKQVLNVIKELDTDITIKAIDKRQIEIKSGDTKLQLYTEDSEEFPILKNEDNTLYQCVVQKNDFIETIDKMLAIKPVPGERRTHITCINMQIKNNLLQIASTDGHRLYYSEFDILENPEFDINFMIPKNQIKYLKSLCKNTLQTELNIIVKKRTICLVVDNIEITILLYEGSFPDYSNIINDNAVTHNFNVDTKQIIKSCKKIKALDKDCNSIQLILNKNQLCLTATQTNSEIKCDVKIDFNDDIEAEYYIDPVKLNCFVSSAKKENMNIEIIKKSFIRSEFDNNIFVLMLKLK